MFFPLSKDWREFGSGGTAKISHASFCCQPIANCRTEIGNLRENSIRPFTIK
jgi:hypothetical protein